MLVGRIMPTPEAEAESESESDADAEAQKRFAGLRYTGT
ncbi:hypothetical protein EGY16_19825 [Burkholderia pseudomallei]|nr:hypothetical protein EGY16_19825 [Burkholderia pseudomallei]EDO83172.1 hypothetical protein BURPS406E_B0265 [Burkholderia pseudomallei 406e]OMR42651.1 hypothetical protein AQ725_17125 [Burkholderia pseudomallei]OMV30278.1 hypothetical protein AQ790_30610 [Burkholderia pseudomallei]ONE11701.1 hypothetical protein AQ946_13460 [Burkholderia pseudomallei]